jgi:hypothetical protein
VSVVEDICDRIPNRAPRCHEMIAENIGVWIQTGQSAQFGQFRTLDATSYIVNNRPATQGGRAIKATCRSDRRHGDR